MFTVTDEQTWKTWVENNNDPYGAAIIAYARRWAELMEAKLSEGAKLEEIAESTSHEADAEGITGFMYNAAAQVIASCWVHGEELRRWHNLKEQIGNEGEKANEAGGFLNSAILVVGGD